MIVFWLALLSPFYWLMVETHWLTVRLPLYTKRRTAVVELVELVPIIGAAYILASLTKAFFKTNRKV